MAYQYTIGAISSGDTYPITVTFEQLDDTLANTLDSIKRYDASDSTDTGTSIADYASISGNTVTLTELGTSTAGKYKIEIIVSNPGATTTLTAEIFLTVN